MQMLQPSCLCGRVFTQQSALTNHQRTCSKSKKRLSSTLDRAKTLLSSKRRRIEQVPSGLGEVLLDSPESCSPLPTVSSQVIIYSDLKSIIWLTLLLRLRLYHLNKQTKRNLWLQGNSADRIASFPCDSEIFFLNLSQACHLSINQPNHLLRPLKHSPEPYKGIIDSLFPAGFSEPLVIFLALCVSISHTNFLRLILRRTSHWLNYLTSQQHLPGVTSTSPPISTHSQTKVRFAWATGTGPEVCRNRYKVSKTWLTLSVIPTLILEIFVKQSGTKSTRFLERT